jgi:hypothetical protein
MFRKSAALSLLVACFTVVLWSTVALAEERERESREAQIKQLRGQIGELEQALKRADTDKEAAELKGKLQERRKKIERLMGESRKPGEEFPEIQQAIRRANGNLEELRQAVNALKEEGEQPEKLKELQQRIAQEEEKLVELKNLLRKRRANVEQKRDRPQTKLMFLPVEHANAQNLSKIIQEFLTPSGIIVADSDTNIIVIKATPGDLEIASAIIKNLDIPRRRREDREHPRGDQPSRPQERREESDRPGREENRGVFLGEVLKAGRESLTIKARDSEEEVTLYVPVRRRDDGTSAPNEPLAVQVSRLDPGSNVRVQWRQGDVRRLIVRVSKIEE